MDRHYHLWQGLCGNCRRPDQPPSKKSFLTANTSWIKSDIGIPLGIPGWFAGCESGDAKRHFSFRPPRRSWSAVCVGSRSERSTEACLARLDRVAERRRGGHERDRARDRQVQDLRLALAGTLRRRGASKACCATRRGLRASRKLDPAFAQRVVALTMEPPAEATHWTGAAMADAVGVSVSSVQRIWRAHGLQPLRVR
jgi:hypothetical protein